MNNKPKKRLLISLLAAGLVLLALAFCGLAYVVVMRPIALTRALQWIAIGALIITVPLFGVGLGALVLSLRSNRSFPSLTGPIRTTVNTLMPLAMGLGRIIGVSRDAIWQSFIEINNRLVSMRRKKIEPGRLLVLLPHCMQFSQCERRVSGDPANCVRCGRCGIGEMVDLAEQHGFTLRVATGGGQAREAVKMLRPKAVIAVACERELTSGLQDVGAVPVVGILNERPHGPCQNTAADCGAVMQAIRQFVSGGEA